jgi:Arc/MetJ-type ribon-helix-helix transcriptional regulator
MLPLKGNMPMPKENLSVSLSPRMRSALEKEARRGKRSRSAVVRDALQLYLRLREIGHEQPTAEERAAIAAGRGAYGRRDVVALDDWRHAVGLTDH